MQFDDVKNSYDVMTNEGLMEERVFRYFCQMRWPVFPGP